MTLLAPRRVVSDSLLIRLIQIIRVHLIDNDYYQDDAEGSQADDVEVIILSSDSDPLPTSKIR